MVNMNKHKDPCVYGLWEPGAGVFYVGRTSINAQNRLWEHIYRARSGHQAPVYQKMRDTGIEKVSFVVLERSSTEALKEKESQWIVRLRADGYELANDVGPNGEMSDRSKRMIGDSRKGKPTWIKGKRGKEAGWTDERRKMQSERTKSRNAGRIDASPQKKDTP